MLNRTFHVFLILLVTHVCAALLYPLTVGIHFFATLRRHFFLGWMDGVLLCPVTIQEL